MNERIIRIKTSYYVQGDADFRSSVPESAFRGWESTELELSLDHTAVVCMHAWDCGSYDEFPGWHRIVPYIPRAAAIARETFPALFAAVRQSPWPLIHVVGGGDYYKALRGYRRTLELHPNAAEPVQVVETDPVRDRLEAFRESAVYPRDENLRDVREGFTQIDFDPNARPINDEFICENGEQLFSVCRELNINHLIYMGFAVDMCLLLSPGGMRDMNPRGLMCSVICDATLAVETKESAPSEMAKEIGLWRVAHLYGFVYESQSLIQALAQFR